MAQSNPATITRNGVVYVRADAVPASKPATFATSAAIKAGTAGFPCTAAVPCSRTLHTAARAAVHGNTSAKTADGGGHEAR